MIALSKFKVLVLFLLALCLSAPAFSQSLSVAKSNQKFMRDVQSALVAKGYDVGTVDGLWGGKTAQAYNQMRGDLRRADEYFTGDLAGMLRKLNLSPSDYASPVDLNKPVGNPPSCADLNKAWQWYRAVTYLELFENGNSFSCPTKLSNAALSIYLLDALDIIEESGKERFDYFRYVFPITLGIFPGDKAASQGSGGITTLGTSLLATHSKNGNRLALLGVEGAETLVHERRHTDWDVTGGVVKHVKCRPTDQFRDCDSKLSLLLDLPNGLEDSSVGAYSLSVAYLIDIIRFSDSNHKERSKYVLGVILKSSFVEGGVTQAQITKINTLLGTDYTL